MILHAQLPERQVSTLGPAFNELGKGSFTQSDSVTVTNVTLTGKMGMKPILLIALSIQKIKGAALQCYGDCDGVVWCEQTFTASTLQ